jgi:uncharacterized protein (TIGR02996 family)
MSMQSAFLKDIAKNPEDDTPRLVFADWLEENGEPERAAFIRLQCRLATMGKYDLERYGLEAEEAGLLAKHAKQWLKPLSHITTAIEFRRGFPHRFSLTASKFHQIGAEPFTIAPTLREYRVLQPGGGGWDQMLDCPAMEKVTILDAGHQPGVTIERTKALAASKRLRNLRELNLADVALSRTVTDIAHSQHLAKLQKLNVHGCGLGGGGLDTLLNRSRFAKNLTSLDISHNGFNDSPISTLTKWKGTSRLEYLKVGEPHLGDDAGLIFAAGDWSGMRELFVYFCRMGAEGLDALGGCSSLSGLRTLQLNFLAGQRVDGLLSSRHLAGLEDLRLYAQADIACLATAPMLPNLRALHCDPLDGSLRPVLASPASAGLRELFLRGPGEGNSIAAAIAAASHLTNLRRLSFYNLPLKEEGARVLAGSAHLAGLVELELLWCSFDAAGVEALIASPHLNRLRRLVINSTTELLRGPSFEALQKRFGEDVVRSN